MYTTLDTCVYSVYLKGNTAMSFTQRQINLGLLGSMAVGSLLLLVAVLGTASNNVGAIASVAIPALLAGALTFAYWRGWELALPVTVLIASVVVPLTIPLDGSFLPSTFIPAVLALVLTGVRAVLLSAVIVMGLVLIRVGGAGNYALIATQIPYWLVIGGMVLSRLARDTAERLAHANAQVAEALALAERQTLARDTQNIQLQETLAALAERAQAQETLLNENAAQRAALVAMSIPMLPVQLDVLVVPLVGAFDSTRLHLLELQLLAGITQHRSRAVLLDVTGVPVIDAAIARGLENIVHASRLLGTEIIIVGVRPEVAQTLISTNIAIAGTRTFRDLAAALHTLRR